MDARIQANKEPFAEGFLHIAYCTYARICRRYYLNHLDPAALHLSILSGSITYILTLIPVSSTSSA